MHSFRLIYIYIQVNDLLVIPFLNELEIICLHNRNDIVSTMKWSQLLLSNANNSISSVCTQWSGSKNCYLTLIILLNASFISTQSNGSKYCYVITIIPFRHTFIECQVLLISTNISIQHYWFAQLNCSRYAYVSLTIQLNFYNFFLHMVKWLNSSTWNNWF